MSEISSVDLISRGLGFKDYKPPVKDSSSLITLEYEDAGIVQSGNIDIIFADTGLGEDVSGIPIVDVWGEGLSFYCRTLTLYFNVSATHYIDAWEGLEIWMAAVDDWITPEYDVFIAEIVSPANNPAKRSGDPASNAGVCQLTYNMQDLVVPPAAQLYFYFENKTGGTLGTVIISVTGIVQ